MRAVADNREAEQVEGILFIRHVPSLDYAQVSVLSDGRVWSVVPESIQVLALREVARRELERADPLDDVPGRRWIDDLAEAKAAGLVQQQRHRLGGTWEELFALLADRAKPMVDAGWRVVATSREDSWEFGDSVSCELERSGDMIELEYYENGQLVGYSIVDTENVDQDPGAESSFSVADSTTVAALEAFRGCGWI